MPSPLWEMRRRVGLLLYEWENEGPGRWPKLVWDPECIFGREGQKETKASCHTGACHSLFLCIFSLLLHLYLGPLPSEPWPWLLGWTESLPMVLPLCLLWCGISRVCFASCLWSLPGPPLPLASNQSSQFAGAQFLIVFFSPTGQAALRFRLFQWTESGVHLRGSFWIHGGTSYLCNSIEKKGAK